MTAGYDDMMELALEKLKNSGKDYTREELDEVYDHTIKFIKKELREKPWLSIIFPGFGVAYYKYETVSRKFRAYGRSNVYRYRAAGIWARRRLRLREHFNKYQPHLNARKSYEFYPFIKSKLDRDLFNSTMEDIETLQNSQ